MSEPLVINPTLTLPASDLHWTATRASGPGGQNVNKVSSKVELRFDLAHSAALPGFAKARLRELAGSKVASTGELLVTSQKTRDQTKNLADAREKLRELVVRALERPTVRRATKPSRSQKRARLADKRHQGDKKAARRTSED
jgi:ribosome-associated protein